MKARHRRANQPPHASAKSAYPTWESGMAAKRHKRRKNDVRECRSAFELFEPFCGHSLLTDPPEVPFGAEKDRAVDDHRGGEGLLAEHIGREQLEGAAGFHD